MPSTVICHTPECGNEGEPIPMELTWTDEDGQSHPVGFVTCGACGEPITDVDPPLGTP